MTVSNVRLPLPVGTFRNSSSEYDSPTVESTRSDLTVMSRTISSFGSTRKFTRSRWERYSLTILLTLACSAKTWTVYVPGARFLNAYRPFDEV